MYNVGAPSRQQLLDARLLKEKEGASTPPATTPRYMLPGIYLRPTNDGAYLTLSVAREDTEQNKTTRSSSIGNINVTRCSRKSSHNCSTSGLES